MTFTNQRRFCENLFREKLFFKFRNDLKFFNNIN